MLVLSRKVGEKVVFPGLDISIHILKTGSNRIQVGIDAPEHISIVRGEKVESGQIDCKADSRSCSGQPYGIVLDVDARDEAREARENYCVIAG